MIEAKDRRAYTIRILDAQKRHSEAERVREDALLVSASEIPKIYNKQEVEGYSQALTLLIEAFKEWTQEQGLYTHGPIQRFGEPGRFNRESHLFLTYETREDEGVIIIQRLGIDFLPRRDRFITQDKMSAKTKLLAPESCASYKGRDMRLDEALLYLPSDSSSTDIHTIVIEPVVFCLRPNKIDVINLLTLASFNNA